MARSEAGYTETIHISKVNKSLMLNDVADRIKENNPVLEDRNLTQDHIMSFLIRAYLEYEYKELKAKYTKTLKEIKKE